MNPRRVSSKKSALQYVNSVGDDLTSQKINSVMKFLKANGWDESALEDLMVVHYLWDDDNTYDNDRSEVVKAIESLEESMVKVRVGDLKRLVHEAAYAGIFKKGDQTL